MEWREKEDPKNININELKEIGQSGFIINDGVDRKQRPILYILLGKDKFVNNEENKLLKFKYLVYNLEKCFSENKNENVHNLLFIINLKNSSIDMNTINQMKDLFGNIGRYYPECMGNAIIVNSSWSISLLWNFVKGMLPPDTASKFNFINGDMDEVLDEIENFVDLNSNQNIKNYLFF
jgi:hypothetical protein